MCVTNLSCSFLFCWRFSQFFHIYKLQLLDKMVGFSQHQMMLPGMRPRPEKILVDKKDAKENIKSESNATFIFIKGCENYELSIEGKAAKVMCENCANLTVSMEKPLVSGTMELLRSHDVFIKLLDSCEVRIHLEIGIHLGALHSHQMQCS